MSTAVPRGSRTGWRAGIRSLRRWRRSAAGVLFALLMGAGTAAPAAAAPATVDGHVPVKIQQWTDFVGNDIGFTYFKSEAAAFHQQYPWITVQIINSNGIPSGGFQTAIIGHKAPSAMATGSWSTMATMAAAGLVQPAEQYMHTSNFALSSFWPAMQSMVQFSGHTWAWPQEYDTVFFGWNKKLFEAAGLNPNNPPKTWAQMVQDDKILTKRVGGKVVQEGMNPGEGNCLSNRLLGAVFGASVWNPKTGAPTLDSPHWKLAVQQYQQLVAASGGAGVASQFAQNDPQGFENGKVAMEWVCDWYPTVNFPQTFIYGKDYGLAAPPVGPGVRYGTDVYIGSDMFFIPKGAKNPAAAALWFNFLMGTRPVTLWCVAESNVPPTKSGLNDPGFLHSVPWMNVAQRAANLNLVQPYPPIAIYEAYVAAFNKEWGPILANKVPLTNGFLKMQHVAEVTLAQFYRQHPGWPKA